MSSLSLLSSLKSLRLSQVRCPAFIFKEQSGRSSQLFRPNRKCKCEEVEEENKNRLNDGLESDKLEKLKLLRNSKNK